MVVWCEMKLPSLRITVRLSRFSTDSFFFIAVARYDCNIVYYICFFVLFIVVKTDSKVTMCHMGLFFLFSFFFFFVVVVVFFNLPR